MTARSSKSKCGRIFAYLGHKLRSLRTLTILNSIFALLSYPLVLLAGLPFMHNEERKTAFRESCSDYWNYNEYIELENASEILEGLFICSIVVCFLMLAAMFIMSYVIPGKAFRWLYNKTVVDMDYALPVSDNTRFFGDLAAGSIASFVPHILAIGAASGLFFLLPFGDMTRQEVITIFWACMQVVLTGLVSCIMFMASSLLVMSLCGRAVEARIMPFVINGAIVIVHVAAIALMTRGMYGYSNNGDFEFRSIASTSPLGLLLYTLISLTSTASEFETYRLAMFHADVYIPLIIVTVLFFAGAYILVRCRRAERVGSPYVFKAARHIVPSAVMFMIVTLFSLIVLPESGDLKEIDFAGFTGLFVAMCILSFVVFIIMELISGKGFSRFHITAARYGITLAVSMLVCLGIYSFGGLAFERYVPAAEDVERAYLRLELSNYGEEYEGFYYTRTVDRKAIEGAVKAHEHFANEGSDDGKYRFACDFDLKGGSTLSRRYYCSEEEYRAAMDAILTPGFYYEKEFESRFDYVMQYYGTENKDVERVIRWISIDDAWIEVNVPLSEFAEAFREDCENVSYDNMWGKNAEYYPAVIKVEVTGNTDDGEEYFTTDEVYFDIYTWHKNTLSLIEKYSGKDPIVQVSKNSGFALLRIPTSEFVAQGSGRMKNLYMHITSFQPGEFYEYDPEEIYYDTYASGSKFKLSESWDFVLLQGSDYNHALDFNLEKELDEDYNEPYVYMMVYIEDLEPEISSMLAVDLSENAMLVSSKYYDGIENGWGDIFD